MGPDAANEVSSPPKPPSIAARVVSRVWTGNRGRNKLPTIFGVVVAVLGEIGGYAGLFPQDSRLHLICAACILLGAALTWPKDKGGPVVAVGIFILGCLLAAPARADFLVHCLQGCPEEGTSSDPPRSLTVLPPDTQIGATIWVGPSIGFNSAVRDSGSKTWDLTFQPTIGWGLKWRPHGWVATQSLAAIDLFLSADFGDRAHVDVLPVVTLLNSVSIGFGPRISLPNGGASGGSWLFSLGFATALGGP